MTGWMDGGWMMGEQSVSPGQPTANDPTPRKGWRHERMDGDNGGYRGRKTGERNNRTRR